MKGCFLLLSRHFCPFPNKGNLDSWWEAGFWLGSCWVSKDGLYLGRDVCVWKGKGSDIFRLQASSGRVEDRSIFRGILCHPQRTQKVTKHLAGFLWGKLLRAGELLRILSHDEVWLHHQSDSQRTQNTPTPTCPQPCFESYLVAWWQHTWRWHKFSNHKRLGLILTERPRWCVLAPNGRWYSSNMERILYRVSALPLPGYLIMGLWLNLSELSFLICKVKHQLKWFLKSF